jgi:hypothetical protein
MSAISTPVTPSNRRRMAPFIALGAVVVFAAAWFLVLHKHGSSSDSGSSSATGSTPATTTPGAAPATATPATGTPAPSAHAATKPAHHAAAPPAHLSDPFGRGAGSSSTSSSAPSTSSPSTVSPAPAASQPSAPVSSTPTPAGSSGGASSPTTATPVSSTGTVTADPTTTTTTPAAVAPRPWRVYRADVRVTPAKTEVHRRLARLTLLGDAQVPFAVYLGAVRGGKRVAFLLNRFATVTGPGRCAPFRRISRTLYLKPNQAVHVTIPFFGTTVTYRLGVMHLTSHRVSSAHLARVANHRVSKSGHTLMRRLGLLTAVPFSTERGVVPAPKHLKSCA